MTLAELANVGEVLGGLAVLVSLIYLIVEVRRSNRNARSDSAWNATLALAQLCEEIAATPQLAGVVMRSMEPDANPDDLTPDEFSQMFFICRSVLFKYEGQWYLWREGSLSDEMWQNRRRWAKAFVSLPIPGRVWELEMAQHQYSSGFIESIESMSLSGDLAIRASALRA